MRSFLFIFFIFSSSLNPILSQPNLLERAKNNPSEGSKLCKKFKEFNEQENKSATFNRIRDVVSLIQKKQRNKNE